MPEFVLGSQGVLYYASDGPIDGTTPTFVNALWVEIPNVMDVDDDFSSDSIDTTTRAEAKSGWNSETRTTKSGTIKFTSRWKPGGTDAAFDALRDAWLTNAAIAVMDLDGAKDVNGNQGLAANFTVSFSKKKPVKGIMTVEVELSVNSWPTWVLVAGDVLTDALA